MWHFHCGMMQRVEKSPGTLETAETAAFSSSATLNSGKFPNGSDVKFRVKRVKTRTRDRNKTCILLL